MQVPVPTADAVRSPRAIDQLERRPLSGWLGPLLRRQQSTAARSETVRSGDGTELAAISMGASAARPAVVYAHGFLSGKDHRSVPSFLSALSRDWAVYAFDFRGHGQSGGACRFAEGERADLDAVVRLARDRGHSVVLTIGSSMGGATVIRHAAAGGAVDGVVTIGAYARAGRLSRISTEGLLRLAFSRPFGQALLRQSIGARMGRLSIAEGQPVDLIAQLHPRPVLLIHGRLDPLIPVADARRLQAAGGQHCDLVLRPWRGHDQPHLNRDTARHIASWARSRGLV